MNNYSNYSHHTFNENEIRDPSYNIVNNTHIIYDENGKEISDFSSYNSFSKNKGMNSIKEDLQSELDYLSNLNSNLSTSTSKRFSVSTTSTKNKSSNNYSPRMMTVAPSSKMSYTESITENSSENLQNSSLSTEHIYDETYEKNNYFYNKNSNNNNNNNNNNLTKNHGKNDYKDDDNETLSFSSFNKQLNNNYNELEHKLIKVCSGILSETEFKQSKYGIKFFSIFSYVILFILFILIYKFFYYFFFLTKI